MSLTHEQVRTALVRPVPDARIPGMPEAAVAAILGPNLDLLLVRRAERPGDTWSGHLALPGGRRDRQDSDLIATAVRETREEVGINLERGHLLGPLDPIPTRPGLPPLVVYPFVFLLPDPPDVSANEEIADHMPVPLHMLLSGSSRGTFRYKRGEYDLDLPSVELPLGTLWGLTLMIIDDLLHRLDGQGVGLNRPAARHS